MITVLDKGFPILGARWLMYIISNSNPLKTVK